MANSTNVNDVKNKVQGAANKAGEQAKDLASSVSERASDVAHDLGQAGRSAVSGAGHMAENATAKVGEGMKTLAQSVREYSPGSGTLGTAASTVADSLESGASYLQKEGLSGMADDLSGVIKRNPIPAVLVGIGLGFLLARVTRS